MCLDFRPQGVIADGGNVVIADGGDAGNHIGAWGDTGCGLSIAERNQFLLRQIYGGGIYFGRREFGWT